MYFPGLISLVFLPLMCVCYFLAQGKFNKLSKIDIAWGTDRLVNDYLKTQKKSNMSQVRRFDDFVLTGDKYHDKPYLDNLPNQINKLAVAGDTVNGIRISLTSHATYDEFVRSIDAYFQFENKAIVLLPYHDKFYVWRVGHEIKSKHVPLPCGGIVSYVDVPAKPNIPFFSVENIKGTLTNVIGFLVEFWPPVLAFILMLSFMILKKRRFLNLKTFRLGEQ